MKEKLDHLVEKDGKGDREGENLRIRDCVPGGKLDHLVEKDGKGVREGENLRIRDCAPGGKLDHLVEKDGKGVREDENLRIRDCVPGGTLDHLVEKDGKGNREGRNPRIRDRVPEGTDGAGWIGSLESEEEQRIGNWGEFAEQAKDGRPTTTDGTFTLIGKTLFFSERRNSSLRLCIPKSNVSDIIHLCHNTSGHPGTR